MSWAAMSARHCIRAIVTVLLFAIGDASICFAGDTSEAASAAQELRRLGCRVDYGRDAAQSPSVTIGDKCDLPASIKLLHRIAKINSLRFSNHTFSQQHCEELSAQKLQVDHLTVINCAFAGKVELNLSGLKGLKSVRMLRVRGLSTNVLCWLSGCQTLSMIEFDNCDMQDEHLEVLDKCSMLKFLSLARCPVSDDGILKLSPRPTIRRLNLTSCGIGDAAVASLAKWQSLDTVILDKSGVSDVGIKELCKSARLRFVYVGRTSVTDECIAECMRVSPTISIRRGIE